MLYLEAFSVLANGIQNAARIKCEKNEGGGTSLDEIQEKFKKSQEEVLGSRLDSLTACINNSQRMLASSINESQQMMMRALERVLEKSSR